MIKYHYEYRINKKGAECFRTSDKEHCLERLTRLQALRPGVYTMQTRSVRLDRYGCEMFDPLTGKTRWSCWS